ncbi:MAG: hypothetical protein QM820_34975 [Minicystis sp.]
MSPATLAWLSAFGFTQAVEVPIYVLALRRTSAEEVATPIEGPRALLAAAFGASLITHPIVWFVFPQLWMMLPRLPFGSYNGMVLAAETFAIVTEGLYFYLLGAMGFRRSMLWALVANLTSVTLGLASRARYGWP